MQTAHPYAASYIVAAPTYTLESIGAELLPLAKAAGFATLSLSQSLSTGYGSRYTAHGLLSEDQDFAVTTLATGIGCTTMAKMRDAALQSLSAMAGHLGGNL